jgi:hypothetical protein
MERRRSSRVQLPEHEYCELHLVLPVRLLDISVSGVFVGSDVQLPVGTQGQLRFGIDANGFAPTVEVKRPARTPQGEGFGVVFRSMDAGSRRRLEEFLRKGAS